MKRTAILISCLSFISLFGNCSAIGESKQKKANSAAEPQGFEKGMKAHIDAVLLANQGKYAEAIAKLNSIGTLGPDQINLRGQILLRTEAFEKAIADFNQFLNSRADDAEAFENRGRCFKGLKEYEKAKDNADRAIKLKPELGSAYGLKAISLCSLNQLDAGMEVCNKGLLIDSADPEMLFTRARLLKLQKRYEDAANDLKELLKTKTGVKLEAWKLKAECDMSSKHFDAGLEDCNNWLKLAPNDPFAYSGKATAYFFQQDYEKALVEIDKAIQLKGDVAEFHSRRGLCFLSQEKLAAARASFLKSKELGADTSSVMDILERMEKDPRITPK